jgi:hypothetical protein
MIKQAAQQDFDYVGQGHHRILARPRTEEGEGPKAAIFRAAIVIASVES